MTSDIGLRHGSTWLEAVQHSQPGSRRCISCSSTREARSSPTLPWAYHWEILGYLGRPCASQGDRGSKNLSKLGLKHNFAKSTRVYPFTASQGQTKGTNGAKFAVFFFFFFFADFCRFSLFLGITAFRRRGKPQETAEVRRKPRARLGKSPKPPDLLLLAFLDFLAFLLFKEFLAILSACPFFPKDLRGSASIRNPLFIWWFSLPLLQKGKEKKIRGDGLKKRSRQFATNVTTIYDILGHFATFYDNFRLFVPLT